MSDPNAPGRNIPPHPDNSPALGERRHAAVAICDHLEYLLADGCERGPLLDYTLDGWLRKHIGDLQRTYPPSNRLPGEGAKLWR